jgi:Putative zinc- or iron-chelating domain
MSDDVDDRDRATPVTRGELEDAMRFLHVMAMQTKLAVERIDIQLAILSGVLREVGVIADDAVQRRTPEAQNQARERSLEEHHVRTGPVANKYETPSPDVPCATLMPICQSRCCRLTVHLSFQDLDEGLRWQYTRPYELQRGDEDGYCVYSSPTTRHCGIYHKRPGICRSYDCRTDKRVWLDFDARIPAPLEASDPVLYQLRKKR